LSLADWPAELVKPRQAVRVDFEHKPNGGPLSVVGGKVYLRLRAKQIMTILLS
jgi:hypothetical protein